MIRQHDVVLAIIRPPLEMVGQSEGSCDRGGGAGATWMMRGVPYLASRAIAWQAWAGVVLGPDRLLAASGV